MHIKFQAKEGAAYFVYYTRLVKSIVPSKIEFDCAVLNTIFVQNIAQNIVVRHCSKFQIKSSIKLAVLRQSM